MNTRSMQWKIQGEGPKYRDPFPHQTWRLFDTEILTSKGSDITYQLADFLFFLMKGTLHFATKLYVSQHTSFAYNWL